MGCGVIVQPQLFGFEGLKSPFKPAVGLGHSAHLLTRLLKPRAAGAQAGLLQLQVLQQMLF